MDTIKEWLSENKEYLPWVLIIILLIVNLITLLPQEKKENNELDITEEIFYEEENDQQEIPQVTDALSETTEESQNVESQNEAPEHIFVDIKGAVNAPGVYEMEEGDRVTDLVDKAQGFNQEADVTKINLAQKIEDQMMFYIPMEGEIVEEILVQSLPNSDSGQSENNKDTLVNINTADTAVLMTLNGIGEKKAQAILEYREENGSFQTIEDIKNISGIGDKSFENIKDSITVMD